MLAEIFTPEQITILTQIIFIDLVLAGDNAIIIGMVASKFPVNQRKQIKAQCKHICPSAYPEY